MCPHCRAFITTDDKICPYCQTEVAPKPYYRRPPQDALGGLIPHARFTTVIIMVINLGLFAATVLRNGNPDLTAGTLIQFGAKWHPGIARGEWWRLVTAGFLHGGLLHIGMNMWVLWDLGTQVEAVYGTPRYLAIYLMSSITGFMASFFWSLSVSVGASAGLCGLIGAMIALGMRERSSYASAIRQHYLIWAGYILLTGLLGFFAIDNAAHLGGLTGGFAVAYVAGTPTLSRATERVWQGIAGVMVGITILSFYYMAQYLMASR